MNEKIRKQLEEARDALILEQGDIAGQIAALNYVLEGVKGAIPATLTKKTGKGGLSTGSDIRGSFSVPSRGPKVKRNLMADPKDCQRLYDELEKGSATASELSIATGIGIKITYRCLAELATHERIGWDGKGKNRLWHLIFIENYTVANGAQAEAGE